MIKQKVLTRFLAKEKFFAYALKFAVLLGISVAAPLIHFQAVTGTIVNAVLIMAVVMLGRRDAMFLGIFPSVVSIVFGILPLAVSPLIPFIIISNIILVVAFSFIQRENYWKGVVSGSVLKFVFLFSSAMIIAKFFGGNYFSKIALSMFSWQQLLTALAGGVVAYGALRILKKV